MKENKVLRAVHDVFLSVFACFTTGIKKNSMFFEKKLQKLLTIYIYN